MKCSHISFERQTRGRYCLSSAAGVSGGSGRWAFGQWPHPIASCLHPSLGCGGSHGGYSQPSCLCYLRDCIFDFQPEAKQLVTWASWPGSVWTKLLDGQWGSQPQWGRFLCPPCCLSPTLTPLNLQIVFWSWFSGSAILPEHRQDWICHLVIFQKDLVALLRPYSWAQCPSLQGRPPHCAMLWCDPVNWLLPVKWEWNWLPMVFGPLWQQVNHDADRGGSPARAPKWWWCCRNPGGTWW